LDIIVSFFRDVLSGPLYIGLVVFNSILICAGIGYFAEKSQNAKKLKKEFDATHVTIDNDTHNTPSNSGDNKMVNSTVNLQMNTQQAGTQVSASVSNQIPNQMPAGQVLNQMPTGQVVNAPIQNSTQNISTK